MLPDLGLPAMRERLSEFLPLLLVGVVLLVFQLTRADGGVLRLMPPANLAPSTPTPQVALRATTTPRTATPAVGVGRTPAPALCNASRPTFVGGMRTLKLALGANMGEALECERPVDNHGDTQQNTTTGLAYYRSQMNVACFTTGWDHWALTTDGLVHWTGDTVDPPAD
jgi:hypothetical protein